MLIELDELDSIVDLSEDYKTRIKQEIVEKVRAIAENYLDTPNTRDAQLELTEKVTRALYQYCHQNGNLQFTIESNEAEKLDMKIKFTDQVIKDHMTLSLILG